VLFASLFFFTGSYFAHRIAFPSMWKFFASYEVVAVPASAAPAADAAASLPGDGPGLSYLPDLDVTFSFYVKTLLGMGLIFQMPMVVFFLSRFGIVTAKFMLKQFRYALLVIVIVAAVITPSGDPVNLTIFSAPMVALYILSIGVAWMFGKKRPARAEAE
jgi:sec-independent protein translocase protein TatC